MKASVLATVVRMLMGTGVRWANCTPESRQRVYFANHTSHLDTLILWAALPGEIRRLTRPAAARDYWGNGLLRCFIATKLFKAVLVERVNVINGNNPLDALLEAIGSRYSLILFPEGTRNPGPDVGEFKCGLYHLSRTRSDLDLVPVYIQNLDRILPKGAFVPVPLLSFVTFGAPIRLMPNESKAAFLQRARAAVQSLRPT